MKENNKKNITENSEAYNSMGDKEAKPSRLAADSEIYNSERSDHIEKGQFKNMSFKEKIIHFKEYYMIFAIIIIVAILLISSVIILNNKRDTSKNTFYCGFLNGISLEYMIQSEMPKEFAEYLNEQPDYEGTANWKKTYINTFKNDILDTTRIDGYFDDNVFDAFLITSDTFNNYAANGSLMNLSKVFSEEELKELDSRIIFVINKETSEKIPYGILLDNTKYNFLIGSTELKDEDSPIFTVPTCATQLQAAKHFLFFLLEE